MPPPPPPPPAAPSAPPAPVAPTLAEVYAKACEGLAQPAYAQRMRHLKLIANMSPSGIGDYATCPMKAVYDADYPRIEKPQFKCYSDFGKICHWQSQYMIGAAKLEDKPPQAEWDSARTTPDVPGTPANFLARVEQCATVAVSIVKDVSPLPAGHVWQSELKAYSKDWLPQRIGRKGDNCGFGGSIDLVAQDKSVLWDFKFVGAKKVPQDTDINPRFRPDSGLMKVGNAGVKSTYVWQCGSYHILTKIPKTNIVWVGRDGKTKAYVGMDWSTDRGQVFANAIQGFLKFVDTPMFREVAWPNRGDHCDECSHKDRCPAWIVTAAKSPDFKRATANFDVLESLIKDKEVSPVAIPATLLPPPPPVPAPLPPPPPQGLPFNL